MKVNIDIIIEKINKKLNKPLNADVITREFLSGGGVRCFLVYIDGMASKQFINQFIMQPLMTCKSDKLDLFNTVQYNDCQIMYDLEESYIKILKGDTAVFVDGLNYFITCETKMFDKRSISEPVTESVIKGSHEGFNESIRSNITLIRRTIQSPNLITELINVGKINNSSCAVLYIKGLTNKKLVDEIKRRLKKIEADLISGSGMVAQLIEDNKNSIFPSFLTTERPDRVSQYLLAGRIAVVCDSTPYVIIMPVDVGVLFDSPEGGNQRWQSGSFERFLRAFAVVITTTLSGFYLAILNFHQDFVPSDFINQIIGARDSIPFSAFIEILLMEIMFELVREAGLRVPSAAGSAVGVVGGLILGQAAIDASLVSPTTLIVVALSGLANAVIPDYDIAFTIKCIRFAYIIVGNFFGIVGIMCAIVFTLIALADNKSLGISLISKEFNKTYGNVVYQKPLWKQELRLKSLNPEREEQQPKYSRKWD